MLILDIMDKDGFRITIEQDIFDLEMKLEKDNKVFISENFTKLEDIMKSYEFVKIGWKRRYN